VRGLVRAFGRRLVAVEREWKSGLSGVLLNAALLGRQVGQAKKAVPSHRTPKLRVRADALDRQKV